MQTERHERWEKNELEILNTSKHKNRILFILWFWKFMLKSLNL